MIYLYIEAALFVLLLITAPYQLWCDYIGIMNLKRVRDDFKKRGTGPGLTVWSNPLGLYMLARGALLDLFVNVFHASIILRELPRELTVTRRLRRHIEGNTKHAALCLRIRTRLLDGFDPAGIHQ